MASLAAAAPVLNAQQKPADNPPQPAQSAPAGQQTPAQPAGSGGNPFPEDTGNVPVMPNGNSAAQPDVDTGADASRVALPAQDSDPARSPDDAGSAISASPGSESSSTVPDIDRIQPKDDEDTKHKGKKDDQPEFHETAANDIDVGNYELGRRNWKAALSRFQSAMVLDPENPDVFWGMAEAARHLGDLAGAKAYYQKVADYDPDSRHGKEAQKALKDPQIANAQATAASTPKK